MNLFDRAKSVGLSHIKTWLPQGKQEGAEWVCLNPTRGDNSTGSFKVNLDSGKWADFNGDAAGNDVISLYAYLNRDGLYSVATEKGYKNLEGGVQAEAAREILTNHDSSYFPDDNDDFNPPKKKADKWEGYRQIHSIPESFPEPLETLKWFEKLWGEFNRHWIFEDKKGRPLFIVARYYQDGKKNDRPFTLWTNGTETKWRAKNLDGCPVPLWGLTQFEENQNHPILMVEGQKNASDSYDVLSDEFICTSLYRSVKASDLSPLFGRTVYYWFDPDSAGRKKLRMIKEALADHDVIFKSVHSPVGKEKGWDISDAIKEGWTKTQLIDHIKDDKDEFLDDNEFPFRIIGQTSTDLYFFPKETCLIMKFKRSALGKANLMNLMDRSDWGAYYSKPDGGIAWDAAANDMIRRGSETEIFTTSLVRGSGAWMEDSQLVINTGSSIIRKGKEIALFQQETKFVYEKKHKVPYSVKDSLKVDDSRRLIDIVRLLDFSNPEYSFLLAGWLLLAPFGGALKWRSHAWLTGAKGSGKTYIMENIVYPMVGPFGVKALGSSSSAGIRQGLGNCSKPVMIDEAEADTKKKQELIEDMLSMARQASSGAENSADILHGTQDGVGMNWIVKSMFFFASIGPALNHTADRSRVSLLKLKTPIKTNKKNRAENFKRLIESVKVITEPWVISFHSRTLRIFDEVLKTIDIFNEQTTEIMGTRRDGDQYGTLLAGAYMVSNDRAPSAAEAKEFLSGFNLLKNEEPINKEDEELCIDEIMSHKVEVAGIKMTIGTWIRYWFSEETTLLSRGEFNDLGAGIDTNKVRRELEENGIKPVSRGGRTEIHIAVAHPALQRILKGTAWVDTYPEIIERASFCKGSSSGSAHFGSIRKWYKLFDAEGLLIDEVPF